MSDPTTPTSDPNGNQTPAKRRCLFPYACGEEWCDCAPDDVEEAARVQELIEAYSTPDLAAAHRDGKL